MQPGKQKKQPKYNTAAEQACQDADKPGVVPGIFSCQQMKNDCQKEADHTRDEKEDPRYIMSRLMKVPQIPAIDHKEQRRQAQEKNTDKFVICFWHVIGFGA
jgi:hypothetical protein